MMLRVAETCPSKYSTGSERLSRAAGLSIERPPAPMSDARQHELVPDMGGSSGKGRGPSPGVPDDQSVEYEAHSDQEVVIPTVVRQAEEIEHDGNDGDGDADPANRG